MLFRDRAEAGIKLAKEIKKMNLRDIVVLSIPRGGVVVGGGLADVLKAPLDIVVPRKIGSPQNPEVALGAVAQDGSTFLRRDLISLLEINAGTLEKIIDREVREIERRMDIYRGGSDYPDFRENTLILVDDGAATGFTMLAAARFAKNTLRAALLVIAVPVAPPEVMELFANEADRVVCLESPEPFYSVGQFYADFDQTTDREVLALLQRYRDVGGRKDSASG